MKVEWLCVSCVRVLMNDPQDENQIPYASRSRAPRRSINCPAAPGGSSIDGRMPDTRRMHAIDKWDDTPEPGFIDSSIGSTTPSINPAPERTFPQFVVESLWSHEQM